MSIIFGIRAVEGQPVEESHLNKLARATEPYAPDGTVVLATATVGMGIQLYHTHQRSKLETQPLSDQRGNMLCFEGRLDNHEELGSLLDLCSANVADSEIVLATFERWGEKCFARFIGDWALALWSRIDRSLYLARDHAGVRTLYYEAVPGRVMWSTYLETFFVDMPQRPTDEAYFARYLACEPTEDLTPYKGICAVTPGHYVCIRGDKVTRTPHWSWLARDQIRYRMDAEYEEHFFSLFEQSVRRRTGPGAAILAHLSGGMDSSSIVCMSDYIRAQHGAEPEELLDTVSYYDESEPNWNERPYFEAVEAKRRKSGIHLPLPLLSEDLEPAPVAYLWPGADRATYDNERQLMKQTVQKNYRVILSGIGGDELLGGVPNALPELADLLARGSLLSYLRSALAWCLIDRTPWLHMTARVLQFLVRQYLPEHISAQSLPPWATPQLRRLLGKPVHSIQGCLLPLRPSSIANARGGPALLETLPHRLPHHFVRYEWRYPYLDRDLVDFLLRIPREILVRPGRRRAMMRNALRTLVPAEVLERRRKGARSRSVLLTLKHQEQKIGTLVESLPPAMTVLVDQHVLQRVALEAARSGDLRRVHEVLRAIFVRLWNHTDFCSTRDPRALPELAKV